MKTDKLPKFGAIKQPPLTHHKAHLANVSDVSNGICIEHDQISSPSRFNCPDFVIKLHHPRRRNSCSLNCFQRRHTGLHVELELSMQRMTRNPYVSSRHDGHARAT